MTVSANILVVDDDESMRIGCVESLSLEGYRVRSAENALVALQVTEEESFDIFVVDIRMPGLGGLELLAKLREKNPEAVVLVITGYATIESAVEAMRRGAYDYLSKPFTPDMLTAVVRRALEHRLLTLENLCLRQALAEKAGHETIIGRSPAMTQVASLIDKVAPTDATVLIVGETGSGKELVARALHRKSHRKDKPLVTVDCGAIVETLFESELFGHIRGAYTGAVDTTVGKFELANNGTLFLDEIGNISREVQAKLLRAIQEREITKVGSSQRTRVDVRIIAATNNDLVSDIQSGEFREELFYRLSVVPIQIPPLRERAEDIRPLVTHFLAKFASKSRRRISGFSEEALRVMESYRWPGNVRELENTVERALVMAEGSEIQPKDLYFYGGTVQAPSAGTASAEKDSSGHLIAVERREIAQALDRFDWQISKAADYLGINRKTLRDKIRKYSLARS